MILNDFSGESDSLARSEMIEPACKYPDCTVPEGKRAWTGCCYTTIISVQVFFVNLTIMTLSLNQHWLPINQKQATERGRKGGRAQELGRGTLRERERDCQKHAHIYPTGVGVSCTCRTCPAGTFSNASGPATGCQASPSSLAAWTPT